MSDLKRYMKEVSSQLFRQACYGRLISQYEELQARRNELTEQISTARVFGEFIRNLIWTIEGLGGVVTEFQVFKHAFLISHEFVYGFQKECFNLRLGNSRSAANPGILIFLIVLPHLFAVLVIGMPYSRSIKASALPA